MRHFVGVAPLRARTATSSSTSGYGGQVPSLSERGRRGQVHLERGNLPRNNNNRSKTGTCPLVLLQKLADTWSRTARTSRHSAGPFQGTAPSARSRHPGVTAAPGFGTVRCRRLRKLKILRASRDLQIAATAAITRSLVVHSPRYFGSRRSNIAATPSIASLLVTSLLASARS